MLVAFLVSYVVGEQNPTGVRFAEEPISVFDAVLRGGEYTLSSVRKSQR